MFSLLATKYRKNSAENPGGIDRRGINNSMLHDFYARYGFIILSMVVVVESADSHDSKNFVYSELHVTCTCPIFLPVVFFIISNGIPPSHCP